MRLQRHEVDEAAEAPSLRLSSSTTATTTSSSTSASTSSTTNATTGPGDDYWNTGLCTDDPNIPSSPDCMGVDWVGECDRKGQAIWCGGSSASMMPGAEDNLFCFICDPGTECGPDQNGLIDCVPIPNPTTGGDTGTSTGTAGDTGTSTSTTG